MELTIRLVLIVALIGVIGGMGVHYKANYNEHWPYPTNDDLAIEYEQHIRDDTLIFGTVDEIDASDQTAVITVEYSKGTYAMQVHDFTAEMQPGGVIQIYGVLESDYTIRAKNIVVVNPAGVSDLYKYAVSLIGAVLVVILFFRYWTINRESLAFEVR